MVAWDLRSISGAQGQGWKIVYIQGRQGIITTSCSCGIWNRISNFLSVKYPPVTIETRVKWRIYFNDGSIVGLWYLHTLTYVPLHPSPSSPSFRGSFGDPSDKNHHYHIEPLNKLDASVRRWCYPTMAIRPVGRGVRGGSLEPSYWPPKILYTAYLNVLPFVSGPLASLPLRIIAVQTSLVAA